MNSLRVLLGIALVAGSLVLSGGYVQAQGDDSRAEELNRQGKELIRQLDLEGAADLFRQAISLSSDPRYSYNLCYTLEKSGKLDEARAACDVVIDSGDERLGKKAAMIASKIDAKLGPRPEKPSTPEPVDPPSPGPGNPDGARSGPPPPPEPAPPVVESRRIRYGGVLGVASAHMTGGNQSGNVYGMAGGTWLNLPMAGNYELVVDAQFVQRGGSFQDFGADAIAIKNNYVDLGASFRYRIGSGAMSYYLETGLALSYLVSSSSDIDIGEIETNDKDLAALFGLGYVLDTAGGALDFRIRYMIGYLRVNPDTGTSAISAQFHNRTLLLQGGYWF